jgi:DNA-binding transcriptional LysR family regulator
MPREYQYPFELRHLVYFREVARRLHFRKAAEALSIAQPALSRQIAQLEATLGVRLLNRSSRKVELTPAGLALLERVEPVLSALLRVPADMKAVAGGRIGRLRVAFTGLAMATVLPDILRGFHRQLAALKAGEIDCGFFHPDGPSPGIDTTLLLREQNGVLLPADHPLRDKKALRLRDLASTPFVLFPRANNPGFYDRVLAAFASSGVAPQIAEEVWPRSNGVGLVRAGVGATFAAPSESRLLPDKVVFRRLSGPAPESRLVVGWRASPSPTPALAALLSAAARHAAR